MKAVLTIDMPESCSACYLSRWSAVANSRNNNYGIVFCGATKDCRDISEFNFSVRAPFCPLKPVPDDFEIHGGREA